MENAKILVQTFESMGKKVYGGKNGPYVWVHFPGLSSWQVVNQILERAAIVTVPGIGLGPAGDSYIRVSAFAQRICTGSFKEIDKTTIKINYICVQC